jgi:DNA-directed RNA polymerase subunit beta'
LIDDAAGRPARGGLFCERIFGPLDDDRCACGKCVGRERRGVRCEDCGVEVALSRVRNERMGHVSLAAPVAHPWFVTSQPSPIALMLDMTHESLRRVLRFVDYVVLDPGSTPLKTGQLLSRTAERRARDAFGREAFTAGTGAEAARSLLEACEPATVAEQLRQVIGSAGHREPLLERLQVVENFRRSETRPEWMILTQLPVMPAGLRVPIGSGEAARANSDINRGYQRVISVNNRLKHLSKSGASREVLVEAARRLQVSVDALFDGDASADGPPGTGRAPTSGLSNLRRRSAGPAKLDPGTSTVRFVAPDPQLRLHQCGLPRRLAAELFEPLVRSRLDAMRSSSGSERAKPRNARAEFEAARILDRLILENLVLLYRRPALFRCQMQAFEPVLVEGEAIRLHPLLFPAFRVDGDGGQLSVHLPLSLEAHREARTSMTPLHNILHPADGRPIVAPSRDILLGLHGLTLARDGEPGEGMAFGVTSEVEHALAASVVTRHTKIKARVSTYESDARVSKVFDTTPGRVLVAELLPRHARIPFDVVNKALTKTGVANLVDMVFRNCGPSETTIFCERIASLGLQEALREGVSIGKDDLVVSETKAPRVAETHALAAEFRRDYEEGLFTKDESTRKIADAWARCDERIDRDARDQPSTAKRDSSGREAPVDPLRLMRDSGSHAGDIPVRRLTGLYGPVVKPSGEWFAFWITSSLKEGLSPTEFFYSTFAVRRRHAGAAWRAEKAVRLTRKLVDFAEPFAVVEADCGGGAGIRLRADTWDWTSPPLERRLLGRVAAEDIRDASGATIVAAGELIEERHLEPIHGAGIDEVAIRSVVTCGAAGGTCAKCYGRDLASGALAADGSAVGLIAARIIGGAAEIPHRPLVSFRFGMPDDIRFGPSRIESVHDGVVRIRNRALARNTSGELVVLARNVAAVVVGLDGIERATHALPYGAELVVDDGDAIKRGRLIARWNPHHRPILAECDGRVAFEDLVEGATVETVWDESTGIARFEVKEWRRGRVTEPPRPALTVNNEEGRIAKRPGGHDARYPLPIRAILAVEPDSRVKRGDVLAHVPVAVAPEWQDREEPARLENWFEARPGAGTGVVLGAAGTVLIWRVDARMDSIVLFPDDPANRPVAFGAPVGENVLAMNGDRVERGHLLVEGVEGAVSPRDRLAARGNAEFIRDFVDRVRRARWRFDRSFDERHVEVVLARMLRMEEIVDPGDTKFARGERAEKAELRAANAALAIGGKPAVTTPVILGIGDASPRTHASIVALANPRTRRNFLEAVFRGGFG